MPASWRNSSPEKCWVVPLPTLEKLSLPGCALAAAISSFTLLAGKSLRVTSTRPATPVNDTKAKSFTGSNGRFLYSAPTMPCELLIM